MVDSESLRAVLDAWKACASSGVASVTVTLVQARGSAPQEPGAKLLATASGLMAGTIGGGRLEAHALRRAQSLVADSSSAACELETVNLQRDLGMTCGGEVSLLYETHGQRPWNVTVFGAGHVAQSVVRLLATLECQVRVFDPRVEWVQKVCAAPNVRAAAVEDMAAQVAALSAGSYVVVMTQGHATDVPVLRAALERGGFAYVGVMGSAVKSKRIRAELEACGVDAERVAALRCPIGLPIGNNTPNEIAVSVAAELLTVRDERRSRGE
jgi:xanthine dehydrogenase accessory factor